MDEREIRGLFKEQDVIYTRQRAAVYAYLLGTSLPQTAAQIAAGLAAAPQEQGASRKAVKKQGTGQGGEKLWLSTVYRALELFIEKGLVSELRLPQGEALAYFATANTHRHYAVCTACNRMFDLTHCPMADLEAELQEQDFQIEAHRIEIYGLCAACTRLKSAQN